MEWAELLNLLFTLLFLSVVVCLVNRRWQRIRSRVPIVPTEEYKRLDLARKLEAFLIRQLQSRRNCVPVPRLTRLKKNNRSVSGAGHSNGFLKDSLIRRQANVRLSGEKLRRATPKLVAHSPDKMGSTTRWDHEIY